MCGVTVDLARGLRARISMLPERHRVPLLAALQFALTLPSGPRRLAALLDVATRMTAAEDRMPAGSLH